MGDCPMALCNMPSPESGALERGARNCSQHRQNYLNNDFRDEVGKQLPKQFPRTMSGQ